MITILPIKNKIRANQILQTVHGAETNAEVLLMIDTQGELGYVVIDMKSSVLRMLKMEVFGCADLSNLSEQECVCADSMVRAAASFGATIGAYRIECKIAGLEHYAHLVGFIESDNKLCCDLSNFVRISKS